MTLPIPPRARRETLPPEAEEWLRGVDHGSPWSLLATEPELAGVWAEHGARIVGEHAALRPGSRPRRWWERSAPEPRARLGGIGDTLPDAGMAHAPRFEFGLPTGWRRCGDGFSKGLPIDVADPPRYESEATYLRRVGQFLPGEAERLNRGDFRSVRIRP